MTHVTNYCLVLLNDWIADGRLHKVRKFRIPYQMMLKCIEISCCILNVKQSMCRLKNLLIQKN